MFCLRLPSLAPILQPSSVLDIWLCVGAFGPCREPRSQALLRPQMHTTGVQSQRFALCPVLLCVTLHERLRAEKKQNHSGLFASSEILNVVCSITFSLQLCFVAFGTWLWKTSLTLWNPLRLGLDATNHAFQCWSLTFFDQPNIFPSTFHSVHVEISWLNVNSLIYCSKYTTNGRVCPLVFDRRSRVHWRLQTYFSQFMFLGHDIVSHDTWCNISNIMFSKLDNSGMEGQIYCTY